MNSDQFQLTFKVLKTAFKKYEKNLTIKTNNNDKYHLYAGYSKKYKRDIYFGGAEIKKNYVSFHLMPVYIHPELLSSISPELKKRMQGKSCFNFKEIDKNLLRELSGLTSIGYEYFKKEGML